MRGGAYPFYPCPCGSGKKFKFCCGPARAGRAAAVAEAEPRPSSAGSGAMFEATREWFRSPLLACYLNPEWRDLRLASLLVARSVRNVVFAHAYLVDLMGPGLRDCYPLAPMPVRVFRKNVLRVFRDRVGGVETAPLHRAGELIWGGLTIARRRGFELPACVETCCRAAGETPAESKLDLSIFDPIPPEEERLPLLEMRPVGIGREKVFRVVEAEPERRVREHIRDMRSFAEFYGGLGRRWERNEGGRLIMPLYNQEDLEGLRLLGQMKLTNAHDIVCFSRVEYNHCDMEDVVDSLMEWMNLRVLQDSGDQIRLAWERPAPRTRASAFSLFRGSRQAMGEITVTPMRLVLEARSRLFLYSGRIWIENALPGLVPVEFSYCSLQDLLP